MHSFQGYKIGWGCIREDVGDQQMLTTFGANGKMHQGGAFWAGQFK